MDNIEYDNEIVEMDAAELDNIIKAAEKKARKRGTLIGSLVTIGVVTFCMLFAIGGFILFRVVKGSVPVSALSPFSSGVINNDAYKKIEGINTLIENMYIDEPDKDSLRDGMYKGLVDSLGDKYSSYYTKEEFDEMMAASSGSFEGIGAYMQQDPETMKIEVTRPMKNSPAERAGLVPGDEIISVDGEDVTGQDINLVVSKIKGPAHTKVLLGVKRVGEEDIIEFEIERELVHEMSAEGKMLDEDNKIGYIYITSFEDDTANQFRDEMNALRNKGMEKLIIDLRDNGGGYVDVCVDMCDMILPECNVVSMKDRHGIKTNYDSSDKEFIRMPIVILVNGNTASASEIMTGALKDNDYATVVGEKTFGKGIVQDVLGLDDGSGLKLTCSKYYTPSGECIHEVGIEPDVEIALDVDRLINDGIDNQLEKAVEIIMGE